MRELTAADIERLQGIVVVYEGREVFGCMARQWSEAQIVAFLDAPEAELWRAFRDAASATDDGAPRAIMDKEQVAGRVKSGIVRRDVLRRCLIEGAATLRESGGAR